jgi:putative methyltransferase (TIGR04325 family)
LIVNLLPLCTGDSFVTLQNIGSSFCPYKIQNRDVFIAGVRSAGYELIDEWQNAEKSCHIQFEAARSLNYYSGMLFERQG